MKDISWTQVAVFAVVALLVFAMGMGLLGMFWGGGYGSGRMMRGWFPWWCGTGRYVGSPFGWFLRALMWLFPLGFLALLVLGIVWLVQALRGPGTGKASVQALLTCPECHRPVQTDWQVCPYCGKGLGQDSEGG